MSLLPATQLDSAGQLAKCNPFCKTCSLGGTCNLCQIGYALNKQTGQCVYCNGCRNCDPSASENCTSCFSPQVFDKNTSKCLDVVNLSANCLESNLDGSCNICFPGYIVQGTGCVSCQV